MERGCDKERRMIMMYRGCEKVRRMINMERVSFGNED